MDIKSILILLIFIAVFLALFCFGILFIARALRSFGEKKKRVFKPLLYVQESYDKIRRRSRIPCGILYIMASGEKMSPITGNTEIERAYIRFEETLLASFDRKDDILSRVKSGEYIVITRISESALNCTIEQIKQALRLTERIDAQSASLSVSFGAYLIPASSIDFEEAVSRARLAAAEAENAKKGYAAWDYSLQSDYDNRKMVEDKLRDGVKNNNFFLEFQPVIDISSGDIVGGEVLTRLNSDSGILLPSDFIAAVKSRNMDAEFDCWVFEKVCRWISLHTDACRYLNRISVNFSRSTLSVDNIAGKILKKIREYGIDSSFISVELLEDNGDCVYSTETVKNNLSQLKAGGISVLLDDFGDGSTLFDDLKNYSIDAIKISKTVTENIGSRIGERIFKSIVSIAEGMGVSVVCEGIERAEQIDMLKAMGIKLVQGYYFYRPLSPAQFEKAIINNRTRQENGCETADGRSQTADNAGQPSDD